MHMAMLEGGPPHATRTPLRALHGLRGPVEGSHSSMHAPKHTCTPQGERRTPPSPQPPGRGPISTDRRPARCERASSWCQRRAAGGVMIRRGDAKGGSSALGFKPRGGESGHNSFIRPPPSIASTPPPPEDPGGPKEETLLAETSFTKMPCPPSPSPTLLIHGPGGRGHGCPGRGGGRGDGH